MQKKILLTGHTGQVGYELQRSLQGLGELLAPTRAQLDLSDLDQLRDFLRREQPALIINPAAYTAVDRAESEPDLALRINAHAPALIAEEAARIGAPVIHYSTDYVFNGSKRGPYLEDDATDPLNVYGSSKLAGEQALRDAGGAHLIFRTQWVYGMRGKNFLLTMQKLAAQRDELNVVMDQIGAPTWSRTIADATAHVVAMAQGQGEQWWQQRSGIYHLSAQGQTSWHGFASAIVANSALEKKPRVIGIPASDYPTPAQRPANSVLCCDKFTRTFCGLPQWDAALALCMS